MYACEVTGLEVHSSRAPEGVNAIEYAAELIRRVRDIADRLTREEPPHTEFDIAHTTVSVNRIQGGTAGNTVAADCRFLIDIRNLPCTHRDSLIGELRAFGHDKLLPAMRGLYPKADILIRQVADLPAFSTTEDSPEVVAALRASGGARCAYAGFGSEAGFYRGIGIPTVVCGPGSIAQAHKPDEFVSIEQLKRCDEMLVRLLSR
jgi:acetylornithine deacetylase